jgi:hypothetical protein
MRFLPLISIVFFIASCGSAYKDLTRTTGDVSCITKFKPAVTTVLYNTSVDAAGNHLSGLLIMKTMPDSSLRLVFSSETGFKFFDFEFSQRTFKVHYMINKMDKKAVIKTLRKDFQLVLMNNIVVKEGYLQKKDNDHYYTFPEGKDHYYYITNAACDTLLRMERGNKKKMVTEAVTFGYKEGIPDSIHIRHTAFEFEIALKRITDYAQ